jgi:hypothetical protein
LTNTFEGWYAQNMSFADRSYHYYIIFGENKPGKEPWLENEWFNDFEPLFNNIIDISPYKKDTGLRVLEYIKENETDKYWKQYKLGRLKWDKKSHEKWTIKNTDKKDFHHFASWTPLWTICEKNKTAPDVYISISDEKRTNMKNPCQFDAFVTVAVAEEIGNIQKDIILKLSEKFNSKRTVYVKKSWFSGKVDENNKWDLKDWIDCMSTGNGIYVETKKSKSLNMHIIEFNEIEFEPYWEIIY